MPASQLVESRRALLPAFRSAAVAGGLLEVAKLLFTVAQVTPTE